jgi:hypothetical protein
LPPLTLKPIAAPVVLWKEEETTIAKQLNQDLIISHGPELYQAFQPQSNQELIVFPRHRADTART